MNYIDHPAGYKITAGIAPGQTGGRSLRELLQTIRLFVLDMDGTIYLSNRLFDFTMPFLQKLDATGRKYCYFTNNSSKNHQDYLNKLSAMGIPAAPDQMLLSAQVIIEEMRRIHPDDTFYIVGTPSLVEGFRSAGLQIYDDLTSAGGGFSTGGEQTASGGGFSYENASSVIGTENAGSSAAGRPDVVILGFDTTLTYEKLARACRYLRRGAAYYGVNMDYNCPVDDNGVIDYIPDCGSIAKLIECSTGRFPDFYGKPSRHALDYIIRHTGFKEEEIAFVGDRIYTDIAIADGTKALSIMVLTGETQLKDLEQYDYQPDIILPTLAEITDLL